MHCLRLCEFFIWYSYCLLLVKITAQRWNFIWYKFGLIRSFIFSKEIYLWGELGIPLPKVSDFPNHKAFFHWTGAKQLMLRACLLGCFMVTTVSSFEVPWPGIPFLVFFICSSSYVLKKRDYSQEREPHFSGPKGNLLPSHSLGWDPSSPWWQRSCPGSIGGQGHPEHWNDPGGRPPHWP